jgi:ABC-2 type transport system ATP-binding protein
MQPAILLDNVTKGYGAHLAVADLDLNVPPGEVMGFLGPNGAGKTTTIRLLMGFLRPDGGQVRLLGCNMADPAQARAARASLGYVPDVAGLDPDATGAWLLEELARLQGRLPVDREMLIDKLELAPGDLRRPVKRLSRGTRQKINIVQGLQHRPELIVLDEPTEGLDPLTKRALFDVLRAARDRGATIFFSSHILSEIEALCDRVALIRRGRLIAVNRIDELRSHLQRQLILYLEPGLLQDEAACLARLPAIHDLQAVEGGWRFSAGDLPALLTELATLPVRDLTIEPPSLEDVFLDYYKPEEKPKGAGRE